MTPAITPTGTPRRDQVLSIVWANFMLAPVIYVVVAYLIVTGSVSGPPAVIPPLVVAAILAAGMLATGIVYLASRRLQDQAGRRFASGAAAALRGTMTEQQRDDLVASYRTLMILRWAGFEALAVYALVITILTHVFAAIVFGATASIALILSNRPRVDDFLQECQYRHGSRDAG